MKNPTLAVLVHSESGVSTLIIATPDTRQVRKIVDTARTLNPAIDILIRVDSGEDSEAEAALLEREGAGTVFLAERELAARMTEHVLARIAQADEKLKLAD